MKLLLLHVLVGGVGTAFGFSAYRASLSTPSVPSSAKSPRALNFCLHGSRNNNDKPSSSSLGLLERANRLVPTFEANAGKKESFLSSTSSSILDDTSANAEQQNAAEIKDLTIVSAISVAALLGTTAVTQDLHIGQAVSTALASLQGFSTAMQAALADPQQAVEQMVATVQDLGPLGPLYYVATYVVFEVLALPVVFVLTSSAGFLFGVTQGTVLALTGAGIAATISFVLGRTILRGPVEGWLEDLPQFRKLDRAIVSQGFQITVLERLSPFFPFALSSYVYGATAIDFPSFLAGTLVGFAPGTFLYVYSGVAGKAFLATLDGTGDTAAPWYYYAGGLVVL